ncbi:MAG: hypothetical protein B6U94_07225 [Thermofilum sp. ex4484_79]|nr:MAG: hypothetical protein B6U94_07225 [Thermofilum sp. ex4484_79]
MARLNVANIVNIQRALCFPRLAGTDGEEKARKIILDELESYGYDPKLHEFQVKTFKIKEAELRILEPWSDEIPCQGVGLSGSTPPEGVEAPLAYAEEGDPALIPGEGYILLLTSRPRYPKYKSLMKWKPKGFVISEPNPYRKISHLDMIHEWRKYGTVPMVYISFADAYKLVVHGARRAYLKLIQDEWDAKSYNIVVEKKGIKYPDEVVIICAHYDSVYDVPGATDNAGGTALLLELARYYSTVNVKRTIRFIWFSGEELGLRGSRAYADGLRKEELEQIKFVVNLDVHGAVIGSNSATLTGPKNVKEYLEVVSKKMGINLKVGEGVYSSDGTSFSKHGIPSISFYRSSGFGITMHTIDDDDRYIGEQAYAGLGDILVDFIDTLVNSEELPFPREIPEDIKKKVEDYFKNRLGVEE